MRSPHVSAVLLCASVVAQSFYIPSDAPTAGSCNLIPWGDAGTATWSNQIYQTIATAADLRNHPGQITAIGFAPCGTGTHQNTRLRITMSLVPPSYVLSATFANNLPAPVLVLDVTNLVWDVTANRWNSIQLQTPFAYDGVSDLVVEVIAEGNTNTAAAAVGGMHQDVRPRAYRYGWTGAPPATGTVGTMAALKWCVTLETWDDGPLIGAPFACLVNDTTGSLPPQRIYSKKAGFTAVNARTAPPAGGPDFRFGRVFRDRTSGMLPPGLRIDAMSTGLDVLNIDPATGEISLLPGAVQGILLGFEHEVGTHSTRGTLLREDSKPDGAGTDVFDLFVSATASGLTSALNRELDGREIGLSDGTAASVTGQITSLDLPLTAWDLDGGVLGMLPAHPRIFFSVPSANVGAVPNNWWPPADRNGATILYTEWDTPAAPNDWSLPQVFATRSDLLLDAGDDVDALAIQWSATAATTTVVFSTQPSSRNQLLVVQLPFVDGDPQPVMVSGTTATEAAGAGSANVASVCFWDPSLNGQVPCATSRWSYVLGAQDGTAILPTPIAPQLLASSAIRACPGGVPSIACMAAGWTTSGRSTPPRFGFGVHMFSVTTSGSTLPPPFGSFVTTAILARPMSSFDGDPMTTYLPLGPYTLPDPTGRCPVWFLWSWWVGLSTDLTSTEFAQSRPVRIRL